MRNESKINVSSTDHALINDIMLLSNVNDFMRKHKESNSTQKYCEIPKHFPV